MRGSWKSYRYRIESWGCETFATWIPRLSRRGCVGLGQLLGALAFWCDGRGRSIGLANIALALGHRLTKEQQRETVRKSYQNFATTMLSLFWSTNITPENADKYLEISGFTEVLEQSAREGRGIVFVCGHQGNWEWASVAFGLCGGQASIVAEDFKNPALTDLFVKLRSRGIHRVLGQERSVLRMLKTVLKGQHVALLGDLNLDPGGAAVVVEAFKREGAALEICATRLHSLMTNRGNALLVPALTEPLPNGKVRVLVQPPIEAQGASDRQLAQLSWEVFERHIEKHPELWLWAYKHFRLKPENAAREYPFYSTPNGEFEKMREEV
ncbi:MAG: hypothetical protein EBR81_01335 [Proteobacteria bacterium]|nr:hypothetical protein [Pseudomonadota bacterium]